MRRMGLHVLLAAVWAVGGIARQSAGATPETPKTRDAPQRMPSADRPIVYIGPYVNGLIFGGPDGTGRTRMPRTRDVVGMSICPNGKLAGVLRRTACPPRLWLTFHDVSGQPVGEADLPAKLSGGAVWLGPRKEAVVVLTAPPVGPPIADGPRPGPAPTPARDVYYANARGVAAPVDVPGFSEARFTATPGFAVLAGLGPDKARPGWRVWRLLRYAAPADKRWDAEVRTPRHATLMAPSRYRGPEGAEVTVSLGDEYLHFRPDGTHVARLVNRKGFARRNPGYAARAGAFYETEYLPTAAGQLAEQAALTEKEAAGARAVLKGYIHDWLETLVRCNGRMPVEAHQVLVAKLDKDMATALGESKYDRYLRWRKDTTGRRNALAFLLRPRRDVPPERNRRVKLIYSAAANRARPDP